MEWTDFWWILFETRTIRYRTANVCFGIRGKGREYTGNTGHCEGTLGFHLLGQHPQATLDWPGCPWKTKSLLEYQVRNIRGSNFEMLTNLFSPSRDQMLIISSVAHIFNPDKQHPSVAHTAESNLLKRLEFEEIPTLGVFCYDFAAYSNLSDVLKNVRVFHWNRSISGASLSLDRLFLSSTIESPITVKLNMTIPDEQLRFKLSQVDICQSFIPDSVVESFEKSLLQAVKVRCENHQNVCRKCFSRYVKHNEKKRSLTENGIDLNFYSSDSEDEMRHGMSMVNGITFRECTHASVAILFSGGIDSTIIALMADQFVPENIPIDLLNVAFCNDAPDRETGLAAWAELRSISPKRKWNFVSIHISKEELESYRTKHIKYLVKPLQTYLDDSIGCAVWFATRGKGLLLQEQGSILSAYQTRARVVLLGMGADEQLGGYLRYRKAFAAEGYVGLLEQIAQDLDRISSRNLGRDDRVTADHGIEARFPFLDEDVVGFLNSLPIWQKCNLSLERGKGEKLLLRMLADRMGLNRVVYHEKRAIQFGSRIAKLEFPKVKADMICSKLVE